VNTDEQCAKITYDLGTQISEADLPALRSQILLLLKKFAPGPKPVRVQLCVCLAILAIQMQTWKDVLPTVVSALGNDVASHACILDFLRVLPEEVTEGRKITLSVCGSILSPPTPLPPRHPSLRGSA
jgi:transportin-3